MEIKKDILIIGAGTAGISAAVYLSRSKYSFAIVEKEMIGGKLNIITQIDNYPGFDSISGIELIENFKKQLKARGCEVTPDAISGIQKDGDIYKVIGENNTYIVKSIIIATGSSNKKSGVKGEKEFQGKGISYCAVCDAFFYRNKDVFVFANSKKGYKEALYLENIARKIYLVNDNDLDDEDNSLEHLKVSDKVEFFYPYKIVEFLGDDLGLTGVKIKNIENDEEKIIDCAGAFPFIGDVPSSYFLNGLNLSMDNGYIIVNENTETSLKGIYAAGDIVKKSLKQIVTAGSDGAIAATSVVRYLNSIK